MNNNINITEKDIYRIRTMMVLIFFGLPLLFPMVIGSLFLGIIAIPLILTKLFAVPFVFFIFLILIILLIINGFRKKENRIKIWYVLGLFIISIVFSFFQLSSIEVDKENLLKEETEEMVKVLYMDPYKKFFDDDIAENRVEFVVKENLNKYEFITKVEVPKELDFKEYYDIGFNDELELDFIERKEYNLVDLLKYYYGILIEGLNEGKIYSRNFESVVRKVTIEGNSETIELIKSKMIIEQYD